MTGETAMAHPTEHIPADEPPRQRQSNFCIRAARLGPRGALAVRAVGQLAHHLHRPLQRKNAVSTVIADVQRPSTHGTNFGFDHGVGHSLLLLYDAKTPHGQKVKEFNGLWHDPSNISLSLLYTITKYHICITI